jgi:putative sporulation protein YyaC
MSDGMLMGRVHWSDPLAVDYLSLTIANLPLSRRVTVVCVGTDRSTGDCLGPLIGTRLLKYRETGRLRPEVTVFGTLEDPVHALNLHEYARKVAHPEYQGNTILAIDACLGKSKNVGYISVKRGPLRPGTGVNKQLPWIGDYHIIGIVNVSGFMEHVVLQNTRLSLVMRMAEVIANALVVALASSPASRETALSAPLSL